MPVVRIWWYINILSSYWRFSLFSKSLCFKTTSYSKEKSYVNKLRFFANLQGVCQATEVLSDQVQQALNILKQRKKIKEADQTGMDTFEFTESRMLSSNLKQAQVLWDPRELFLVRQADDVDYCILLAESWFSKNCPFGIPLPVLKRSTS